MDGLKKHAKAFGIMAKKSKGRAGMGLYVDDYHFFANCDPKDLSDSDIKKLSELGWHQGNDDVGEPCFYHFR